MISLSGTSIIMSTDETLKCRRFNRVLGDGVQIIDGKRIYSDFFDFDFICNVQPVTGNDLILVPEGDRFDEQLFCYVPCDVQELTPNTDDFVFRDNWYQVQSNEFWGSYARLRIQRVDVGPDRALGV